jgi:hypothetical protein
MSLCPSNDGREGCDCLADGVGSTSAAVMAAKATDFRRCKAIHERVDVRKMFRCTTSI